MRSGPSLRKICRHAFLLAMPAFVWRCRLSFGDIGFPLAMSRFQIFLQEILIQMNLQWGSTISAFCMTSYKKPTTTITVVMATFSAEQLASLHLVVSRVIQETVPLLIEQAVAPLRADIAGLKADVAVIKADVAVMKTDVAEMQSDVAEMRSRQLNSTKGPRDRLVKVKSSRKAGAIRDARAALGAAQARLAALRLGVPVDHDEVLDATEAVQAAEALLAVAVAAAAMPEFPRTMAHLLVAGNERVPFTLPGPDAAYTWNRVKSRALLTYYGDTLEDGSDTEDGDTARKHRFLVAERIGISRHTLASALSASVAANMYA